MSFEHYDEVVLLNLRDNIRSIYAERVRLTLDARERMGKLLLEAQEVLKRMKKPFGPWIQKNLPFDHIRGNQFMRAYKESVGLQPAPRPKTVVQPQTSSGDIYSDLAKANMELEALRGNGARIVALTAEITKLKAEAVQLRTENYVLRARLNTSSTPSYGQTSVPKDTYRLIRSCLHPDRTNLDVSKLTKAFQEFQQYVKEA